MRLLGIDYGTKRVGIALSDEGGAMAFPHETYINDDNLVKKVVALIEKEGIKDVVIGKSIDLSGEPNAVQEDIDTFSKDLVGEVDITIHTVSEHYTTQAALRLQGRNKNTDASAAALMLDQFIQNK